MELPEGTTKRFKGGQLFFFKGGRAWLFPQKPGRRFRQKSKGRTRKTKLDPFEAVDESDANHVLKQK